MHVHMRACHRLQWPLLDNNNNRTLMMMMIIVVVAMVQKLSTLSGAHTNTMQSRIVLQLARSPARRRLQSTLACTQLASGSGCERNRMNGLQGTGGQLVRVIDLCLSRPACLMTRKLQPQITTTTTTMHVEAISEFPIFGLCVLFLVFARCLVDRLRFDALLMSPLHMIMRRLK